MEDVSSRIKKKKWSNGDDDIESEHGWDGSGDVVPERA